MIQTAIFPNEKAWRYVDIVKHKKLIFSNPGSWVASLEATYKAKIYGGHLENRSPLFDARHEPESLIHLGLDFWLPEYTKVFSPTSGKIVYSTYEPEPTKGWGGRIDIETNQSVIIIAHLQQTQYKRNDTILKGQELGRLGSRDENGGWLPHLHVQAVNRHHYYSFTSPSNIDAYAEPSEDLKFQYPYPQ